MALNEKTQESSKVLEKESKEPALSDASWVAVGDACYGPAGRQRCLLSLPKTNRWFLGCRLIDARSSLGASASRPQRKAECPGRRWTPGYAARTPWAKSRLSISPPGP